ncbi:reverse transcriptase family protein [Stenotrophomonas maltophilia]|uniref:reverse transcriptase family protein n=1 Tax=Stenotrophomonas TaxID=40323 RepID=UPI002E77064D|nr:reverse transcriptase family protein [Stenotrophomonas muris]
MIGPPLHALAKNLSARGYPADYAARVLDAARAMDAKRVPTIFSLMHLAVLTRTRWLDLRNIVLRKGEAYRTFTIGKRAGGRRLICAPHENLRRVQTWIHQNILCSPGAQALLHPAATAYRPQASILKNAGAHAGAEWMVKLDIKDFFESISERQVYYVFRKLAYPALLSFELARLCTRRVPPRKDGHPRVRDQLARWVNWDPERKGGPYAFETQVGHLPQGAPTSAMLANLVASDLDAKIAPVAACYGAAYTRYADDIVLTFLDGSKETCAVVFRKIAQLIQREGFRVNRSKSRVVGPGGRKVVTGLVINDVRPRLPRSFKSDIELAIYHIGKHGLMSHMKRRESRRPLGYLNHLVGKILYCHSVEPAFAGVAMTKLRQALAPQRELLEVAMAFESPEASPAKFHSLYRIIFAPS